MKKVMRLFFSLMLMSVGSVFAEGKGKGGDGFRKAAVKYDAEAKAAFEKGQAEIGKLLRRMAAIKRHAAKLGDDGKWNEIDWTEYKEIGVKVNELRSAARNSSKDKQKKSKGKAK